MQTTVNPQAMSKKAVAKIRNLIILAILALVVVVAAVNAFVVVPAGSSGVVLTFGKVSENVMSEGLNFKLPFVQEVEIISNKIQNFEVDAAAVSQDLQTISSTISVNYRVAYNSSASIFKNIGRDYESIVLMPAIQECVKSVTAQHTAEELITSRSQVGEQMKETLESKISEYGLSIEKFNIVDFDFSEEFNAAIEAKQVAEQTLLKTQTESEIKIVQAEAEAEATLKKATAQAEANRIISESLNENLIEYEKIQKWDGEMPLATGATSILNLDGITESDASAAE